MTLIDPGTDALTSRADRRTAGRAQARTAAASAAAAEAAARKAATDADADAALAALDIEDRSLELAAKRAKASESTRRIRREARRRERRERTTAVRAWLSGLTRSLPAVVAVTAVAALITASVWLAWPAQAEALRPSMGSRSFVVPLVVEGLTWTMASLTMLAVRRGAPAFRYRLLTAVSALIASGINLTHSPNRQAGIVNALASLAGVLAFELVVGLLQFTQSGRSGRDVRAELRRRLAHPRVALTAWRITALSTGHTAAEIWTQAWASHHGGQPGTTARRVRRQLRAEARLSAAYRDAPRRSRLSRGRLPAPRPALPAGTSTPQVASQMPATSKVPRKPRTKKTDTAPGARRQPPAKRGVRKPGDTPRYSAGARSQMAHTAREAVSES